MAKVSMCADELNFVVDELNFVRLVDGVEVKMVFFGELLNEITSKNISSAWWWLD